MLRDVRRVRQIIDAGSSREDSSSTLRRPVTLDRLYAACLSFAIACDRRRALLLWVGGPAYTLLLAGVGAFVLHHFPNSGDEYVYLYQAATLAEGRLDNPAPALPEFFEFNYIAQDQGRVFGTFPPGWPLTLAAAQKLGVPSWLVNPLLGTATIAIVWALGGALHGTRIGVLAAGMTAVSAFFVFNAASFFSHTLCGALLLLAAYLAVRTNRAPFAFPLLVGFLIGWAVVTRYFNGFIGGIVVIALLARTVSPNAFRPLLLVALGGIPWAVLLAAYNHAFSGTPWRLTTTDHTVSLWFAPGVVSRGPDILATQLLRFVLWTPPALLFAYAWYLRRPEPGVRRGPVDWLFVLTAVLLIFYVERGGNQYGPRFYYEAFPFVIVFVAANLFRADALEQAARSTRVLFAAIAASVVLAPLLVAVHASQVRTIIRERTELFRRVEADNLKNAVVLVTGRVGTARSMGPLDLTRNGIHYSGSVLFGLDRGEDENCRLAKVLDRRVYVYAWDAERRSGGLSPLHCSQASRDDGT
jgi:hypothetical protein